MLGHLQLVGEQRAQVILGGGKVANGRVVATNAASTSLLLAEDVIPGGYPTGSRGLWVLTHCSIEVRGVDQDV